MKPETADITGFLKGFLTIICLVTLITVLYDVRAEIRKTSTVIHQNIPEILNKTKTSTETLATLAADVEQLKNLAGATNPRDKTLAKYADDLLDKIEQSNATIGTEAILGHGLSDPLPASEWVVSARKEALYLTFTAKSKHEILTRLTQTKFGRNWMIALNNDHVAVTDPTPIPLINWLNQQGTELPNPYPPNDALTTTALP